VQTIVAIKGVDDKLEVYFNEMASYPSLREDLIQKLQKNKNFFLNSNAKVVISGRNLSPAQRREIKRIFSMDYGISNVYYADEIKKAAEPAVLYQAQETEEKNPPQATLGEIELVSREYFDAKSIFISATVRSGQRIECEGDIVVLGDVNPGAEIIAGGSIAVFGTLRGLAHAGAGGREDVCIAALYMKPKQLRLSGRVLMPDENRKDAVVGEIAQLVEGRVVFRPINRKQEH
jgi:septum site-determining protein MinC